MYTIRLLPRLSDIKRPACVSYGENDTTIILLLLLSFPATLCCSCFVPYGQNLPMNNKRSYASYTEKTLFIGVGSYSSFSIRRNNEKYIGMKSAARSCCWLLLRYDDESKTQDDTPTYTKLDIAKKKTSCWCRCPRRGGIVSSFMVYRSVLYFMYMFIPATCMCVVPVTRRPVRQADERTNERTNEKVNLFVCEAFISAHRIIVVSLSS